MDEEMKSASIIFAAGRGSRMKGPGRNKTLLPLIPGDDPFEGDHPILLHIINNLPAGPKALVINYRREEVIEATRSFGLSYVEQPSLNGTGGALLAALGITIYARMPAAEAYLIGQTSERNRSTILGIYYFSAMEGNGVLTPVMGHLIDQFGFYRSFSIASIALVVMTLVCAIWLWDIRD